MSCFILEVKQKKNKFQWFLFVYWTIRMINIKNKTLKKNYFIIKTLNTR